MKISDFVLYKEYKLDDLIVAFNNGAFRYGQGMIYTKSSNILVLISKHTKDALYEDKIIGDKLHYTGMGQTGDQTITMGNKRLVNAKNDNTAVYLFLCYKENRYKYYGRVELNDPYYFDLEPDKNHAMRKVLKFPLTFVDAFAPMTENELKQQISAGSTPILRVVGACISDGEKYLIARRSEKQGYANKWEFPGGKVEDGETDQEALQRELKEELDINIDVSSLLDTTSYYEKDKNRIISLNVYNASIQSGSIRPKENQTVAWKTIDELENLDWINSDGLIAQTIIDNAPRKIVEVIDFVYKEGKRKMPKSSDIKRECQDYEKTQKRKAKSGEESELAVIAFEANRLNELGRIDFVNQIKQVSKISSDYGYDIISFDVFDGVVKEIHIEVKTATLVGGNIEFFISQAELRNCIEDEQYKIYALIRFGHDYKLHIVKKEEFLSDNRYLSPISYKVSIPVEQF